MFIKLLLQNFISNKITRHVNTQVEGVGVGVGVALYLRLHLHQNDKNLNDKFSYFSLKKRKQDRNLF